MTKKIVLNFILSAICYVALGVALIIWPATSINVFCYVLGGVTAAYGLWQVYRFISHRDERYSTLSLMVGIVALALGICFFVKPELFASILPFILGLYLIFDGVVKLQASIDIKKDGYEKWGILLLLAVLMIALGVVILLNPFQSAQVLITFIGICMLADGVINLFNAFVVWQHLRALKKVAAAAVNAVASAAGATADVVVDAVSTDDIPEEPAPDSVPEPAAEDETQPEEYAENPYILRKCAPPPRCGGVLLYLLRYPPFLLDRDRSKPQPHDDAAHPWGVHEPALEGLEP